VSRNAGQQIIVIPGASRGTGREAAHVFAGGRADGVLAARNCPALGSLPQCLAPLRLGLLPWPGSRCMPRA